MIVFLESDKNDFTIYFNPRIRVGLRQSSVGSVRLISCSLFNSWYNLIGGQVTVSGTSHKIPDSHYTPITLAKELAKHGITLKTGLPYEWGLITAANSSINQPINDLLGTKTVNNKLQYSWKVANAYDVHCSLVRTYDNGRISNIMSKFTPKGNPFDLVEYMPIALTYELSSDLVESIHICIKVDGEVVNFNDRKINLVVEFI